MVGMLTDLSVFQVEEIIQLLENEDIFKERL